MKPATIALACIPLGISDAFSHTQGALPCAAFGEEMGRVSQVDLEIGPSANQTLLDLREESEPLKRKKMVAQVIKYLESSNDYKVVLLDAITCMNRHLMDHHEMLPAGTDAKPSW